MVPSKEFPEKSSCVRLVNSEMKDGIVPERPHNFIVKPRRLLFSGIDWIEGGNSQVPSLNWKEIHSIVGIVNSEDGITPPKSGPVKRSENEFRFFIFPIVVGSDPYNPF